MNSVIFLKCIENNIICIFKGKTMQQWIFFCLKLFNNTVKQLQDICDKRSVAKLPN